ncbi:MAG: DinB family protein [candidate division Zixibacteria bacterium]|nr:DinB family protein [candidate division Zixibacteria bacterium]
MKYNTDQVIAILSRTPATIRTLLSGLDDAWIYGNLGEDTFSPYDVVGHLIHGERTDWIPRAQIILEHGEDKSFEPFDRFAQQTASERQSIGQLLDTFTELRAQNVAILKQLPLTDNNLDKRGVHPEFGSVTLRELLSTWAVHDLNHIMQIVRTMARQYDDNVGPWRKYLSILRREQ